jgi:hypothetical protein
MRIKILGSTLLLTITILIMPNAIFGANACKKTYASARKTCMNVTCKDLKSGKQRWRAKKCQQTYKGRWVRVIGFVTCEQGLGVRNVEGSLKCGS